MSERPPPTPGLYQELERVEQRRDALAAEIDRQRHKLKSLRGQLKKCEEELAMLQRAVGERP